MCKETFNLDSLESFIVTTDCQKQFVAVGTTFNLDSLESFIVTNQFFKWCGVPVPVNFQSRFPRILHCNAFATYRIGLLKLPFNLDSLESFIVTTYLANISPAAESFFQSRFPRILHCNLLPSLEISVHLLLFQSRFPRILHCNHLRWQVGVQVCQLSI